MDYHIIFFLFQTPIIMTASNDLNSSVMISSVKEFHNPNRRGATMKMNIDGVNFVSYTVLYILEIKHCWNHIQAGRKIQFCDSQNFIIYLDV